MTGRKVPVLTKLNSGHGRLEYPQGDDHYYMSTHLEVDGAITSGKVNDIGVAGAQAFGVGIAPYLPDGFSAMTGTFDPAHDNYGNYQFSDGSVMVWLPACFYKVGTGSNGLSVNVIDIKPWWHFGSESAANAEGYALFRADKDGGRITQGQFVDKYLASNNDGVASSIALGDPLSTHADHNPIAGLDGISTNNYATTIDAAKTRGSEFAVCSRFIYAKLAMLAMAHGQAATGSTHCAWYDGGGTTNYPKGCNNNSLGDTDDAGVSYTGDGYSNAPKTGSGDPFAKTTHNGQACGVADLNGCMLEVCLGLTRDSANTDFYVLKEAVAIKDLTSGSGSGNDAWGDTSHLGGLYDVLTASHITDASAWEDFGDGANQVLDESTSGAGYALTGLGLPKDANGQSASGTNLFGQDGLYERHRADLCARSGGYWNHHSIAGVWCASLESHRGASSSYVGFRAACYLY